MVAFMRVLFSKSVNCSGEKIVALAAPPARSTNTGAYALPGFVTLKRSRTGAWLYGTLLAVVVAVDDAVAVAEDDDVVEEDAVAVAVADAVIAALVVDEAVPVELAVRVFKDVAVELDVAVPVFVGVTVREDVVVTEAEPVDVEVGVVE